MARTATTTSLLSRVESSMRDFLERGAGVRVIAAVSGGVDSMAMLDMLLALRKKLSLQIAVAHVNHGLRDSAESDERFVKRYAKEHGLEYFSEEIDVTALAESSHVSTEMAGRAARYAFFHRLLEATHYDAVATAHTRTDNAETVILNITRGGGLNTLAGIPTIRTSGAKSIIRPVLQLDKCELLLYAKARGIKWREDETNSEISIPRNFVRLTVMPELRQLNPRLEEAIGRTSNIVRELLEQLRPEIDKAKTAVRRDFQASKGKSGGSVSIAITPLKGYFGFLRSVALHEILREAFPDVMFGSADIDRLAGLLASQTGVRAQLEGGIVALRDRATITISRTSAERVAAVTLAVNTSARVGEWLVSVREIARDHATPGASQTTEFIDAAATGTTFTVRPWRAGDALVPLGMRTRKNVSDLLTDNKVPSAKRRGVLVIESEGNIVWVCGQRIDDRVKITPNTRRVLALSMTPFEIE